MLETAIFKVDIISSSNSNRCCRTTQPTLIIEFVIVIRTNNFGTNLIGFGQIHSGLQRYMPFFRWTHPCTVVKTDIFENNVLHRTIRSSLYLY